MKERVYKLIEILDKDLIERKEVIAVSLLGILSGQNIFLYGPPGTAKSLIARRLSKAFETKSFFEYLMQKFSTPEEVFGPVSVLEMKHDKFVRKTKGYLPSAELAFLDEIWKASPAILNALLTIINEKIYKNGDKIEKVPLQSLIAASNETPPRNEGLEALYDRFLIRLYVHPIKEKSGFDFLLTHNEITADIEVDKELKIKLRDLSVWHKEIEKVKLSEDTINIIKDMKSRIEEGNRNGEFEIYISDRRWQQAAFLLKAAAFFSDREETNIVDTLLLRHCLWNNEYDRDDIVKIVEESVRDSGFDVDINLKEIDLKKERLEHDIEKEMYNVKKVYKTIKLGKRDYIECSREYEDEYTWSVEKVTFYIPIGKMRSKEEFNPLDRSGNKINWIKCKYNPKEKGFVIKINSEGKHDSFYLKNEASFKESAPICKPEILYEQRNRKENLNPRLIEAFLADIGELKRKIKNSIDSLKEKKNKFLKDSDTPFIPRDKIELAVEGIEEQIKDLEIRYRDCERLEDLVNGR